MNALATHMTEAQLLQAVRDLARMLRLLTYHTHSSIRSEPGFPDLVLVGRGVLYRELKTSKGRVTAAQQQWIDGLIRAGQDAAIWRPEDLASGRVLAEMREIQ